MSISTSQPQTARSAEQSAVHHTDGPFDVLTDTLERRAIRLKILGVRVVRSAAQASATNAHVSLLVFIESILGIRAVYARARGLPGSGMDHRPRSSGDGVSSSIFESRRAAARSYARGGWKRSTSEPCSP